MKNISPLLGLTKVNFPTHNTPSRGSMQILRHTVKFWAEHRKNQGTEGPGGNKSVTNRPTTEPTNLGPGGPARTDTPTKDYEWRGHRPPAQLQLIGSSVSMWDLLSFTE